LYGEVEERWRRWWVGSWPSSLPTAPTLLFTFYPKSILKVEWGLAEGRGGGWRKKHENANWILTAYYVGKSVLKVGWRLAMVRGEVEGRMSRLLASLATNRTNSTVYFLSQVNPEDGMRARGREGRKGANERSPIMQII
jgi:hypothetical protein